MQAINRMYGSADEARRVFDGLKSAGYDQSFLFTRPDHAEGDVQAELVAAMGKAHVTKADAEVYAQKVAAGSAFIRAYAAFGKALRATQIMESEPTIDSGVPEIFDSGYEHDPRAPFSSALELPVRSKTKLPFQAFANMESKAKQKYYALNRGPRSYPGLRTSRFGMPLLTRFKVPTSRFFYPILMASSPLFSSRLANSKLRSLIPTSLPKS